MVGRVAEFLVEFYVSGTDVAGAWRDVERTRRSAAELTREGTPVHYLRSIFVPEDETCFLLLEAGSAEAVREAARRAALPFERVAEAVAAPDGDVRSGRR
jgi:hypothetical protein